MKQNKGTRRGHKTKILDRDLIADIVIGICRTAPTHLGSQALVAAKERIDFAEKQALIPAVFDKRILEKSILEKKCGLCEGDLDKESLETVKGFLEFTESQEVSARAVAARTEIELDLLSLENEMKEYRDSINDLASRLGTVQTDKLEIGYVIGAAVEARDVALENVRLAEMKLNEFLEQAAEIDHDRIETAAAQVEVAILNIVDLNNQINDLTHQIEVKTLKRNEEEANYRAMQGGNEQANLILSAREVIKTVADFFTDIKNGLIDHGRIDLERALNKNYSKVIQKDYYLAVDEAFRYQATEGDKDGAVAPLSQSENTLALTSFAGALAQVAPSLLGETDEQIWSLTGEIETVAAFPMVIDAPVGVLDDEYEKDFVTGLPELLPQVVVPLSYKNIDNWEIISNKIGKSYIVERRGPRINSESTVRWDDQDWPYRTPDPNLSRDEAVIHQTR